MGQGCSNEGTVQVAHGNHGGMPNGVSAPMTQGDVARYLERYIELEDLIADAETNSPKLVLEHKREQQKQVKLKIAEQEDIVNLYEEETLREKQDVENLDQPDTKKLFLEHTKWESKREEEMQEYLDALNREEIAKKELGTLKEKKESLDKELGVLETEAGKLQALYDEQEQLLDQIFEGAYGSEEENRLESILDQTEDMRYRIVEANFKWRQSQLMIDYAYKQLNHAVEKWKEISLIDQGELEKRYTVASETRNNLVAASQNISEAQRYLSNVQFPYCAPAEVSTLNKATAYIFTDMQTPDRHKHALQCYEVTAKRCGALLQWLHQVVNQTISRDLDDINAKVKDSSLKLRQERVRLIKIKVKEVLGKDIDIEVKDVDTDVTVKLNQNAIAKTDGIDANELGLTDEEMKQLKLISDDESLAPMPSNQEVFGQEIERLQTELDGDMQRLREQNKENKDKVQSALEQKLAARRQRRARKRIEEKEKAAYGGSD